MADVYETEGEAVEESAALVPQYRCPFCRREMSAEQLRDHVRECRHTDPVLPESDGPTADAEMAKVEELPADVVEDVSNFERAAALLQDSQQYSREMRPAANRMHKAHQDAAKVGRFFKNVLFPKG